MLFIILKHGIEAEIVYDFLPGQADDQCLFFCPLNMVGLNEIVQKDFVLIRAYLIK
ncbi:hypothetical protein D3C76_1659080 [compost metagenome]